MEHRLVTGGAEYLPFARRCVAKLKKLGLSYAGQSFDIGGVSIRVRIEPGHEYISITGGDGDINMESGVVDLVSISFQNTDPALGYAIPENIYDPGFLYQTNSVKDYVASFTEGGNPKFTNGGESGQFAGWLTGIPGKIRGHVLKADRNALSFSPGNTKTKNDGLQPNKQDSSLAEKKWGARWCPPSMFTGKCRMYVQALMGSPLYDENGNKTKPRQHPYLPPDPYRISLPSLYIPGHKDTGNVVIDTSSGVILDKGTYTHWLFTVQANQINVYPLVSSSAGESAKRALDKISDPNEFDKLEAYILSESFPDVAKKQELVADELPMFGCGYGWHWAWSDAICDIVINDSFSQDANDAHYAMESTHFRLVFRSSNTNASDPKLDTLWTYELVTVSGPTKWTAHFQLFCIAYPLFGSNFLMKMLPKYSKLFNCTAPFYVFYKRDEIQLIEYKGGINDSYADEWGPTSGWVSRWHLGLRDAGYQLDSKGYEIYGEFSGHTGLTKQRHDVFRRHAVSGKSGAGERIIGSYSLLRAVYPKYGYPLEGDVFTGVSTFAYDTILKPPPEFPVSVESGGGYWRTMEYKNEAKETTYTCRNVAAVPFFDAEAIYFYNQQQTTTSQNYKIENTYRTGAMSTTTIVDGAVYEKFVWSQYDTTAPIASSDPPPKTTVDLSKKCELFCSSGTFPAEFNASLLWMFWDPMEGTVSATLATTSGVSQTEPVVISDGYIDAVGAGAGGSAALPIIVGWA